MDYFEPALAEFDYDFGHFEYIHHLYNVITTKKDYYHDNEKIFKKYMWMQNKYNEMVSPMISKQNIERFLEEDPDIMNALSSLKLIS